MILAPNRPPGSFKDLIEAMEMNAFDLLPTMRPAYKTYKENLFGPFPFLP
jgi:hypothetical protein